MNKRTRLLILLSSILVMSMTFLGCKDDERQDIKPLENNTIHLELTANVVTSVPVTRGFNLDVEHTGAGEMTTPINWNSDIWDNVNNKPIVLAIVRDKNSKSAISEVKKLESTEYEYEPGHGAVSPKIHISANFTQSATNNEILFYLLDKKDVNNRLSSSDKTLTFKGGASLYNISNSESPVWLKDISDDVFVEPNDRIYFNFIFSGSIDLSKYKGGTFVNKEFEMNPLGTLLMTDFSPRTASDELNNPAYVEGFRPTLSTNAFDISTKIALVTGSNTNTSTSITSQEVGFETYDATGTSTNAKTLSTEKIGGTPNKLSGVYVKYVLGRSHDGFSISLSNNNIEIFKHNNSTTNFAEEYASSRVPLNFLMTVESVNPTSSSAGEMANNALSYVAETNVNKEKTGFATTNTNEGSVKVTWEEARGLFGKNDYLKDFHLPTRFEWQSIIPYDILSDLAHVYFAKSTTSIYPDNRGGEEAKVEIGKAELENTVSYYQTVSEGGNEGNVTYAIRFAEGTLVKDNNGQTVNKTLSVGDNPYISVWRYSYIDNPHGGGGKMMAVYCKVLPANTTINSSGTLEINTGSGMIDVRNKNFFTKSNGTPKSDVIYREFPTNGLNTGTYGMYWADTFESSGYAYSMSFSDEDASSYHTSTSYRLTVRPFVGNRPATPISPAGEMANNALSYVAENNVNKAGDGFATKNTNADAKLFTLYGVKELFKTPAKNTFLNGYHLPSIYEWQSVIPHSNPDKPVYFDSTKPVREDDRRSGDEYKVEIGKAILENTKSYYQTISEGSKEGNVTYAIRFAEGTLVKDNNGQTVNKTLSVGDNPYISVWRYSYINNPNGGGGKMLAVYCKVLPANTTINSNGTLEINTGSGFVDFKKKSFFAESDGTLKSGVVYREFPTSGYDNYIDVGSGCIYWSSTPGIAGGAHYMRFHSSQAYSDYGSSHFQYAVRPFVGSRPIVENNPLLYVAEHNVNKAKNGFAKKNTNADAALVTWGAAKGLFGKNNFLKNYHLPSRYEWQSIIPYNNSGYEYVYFHSIRGVQTDNRKGVETKVEIGKAVLQNTKSYYQTISEGRKEGNVTYAIRFAEGRLVKDDNGQTVNKALNIGNNPYISVWRYSYITNPNGGGKMLAVYCKVLPANTTINSNGTLEINIGSGMVDFKKKNFFVESNGTTKSDVIYREFPTSGHGPSPSNVGSLGFYWSHDRDSSSDLVYNIHFDDNVAKSSELNSIANLFAVRPFVGNK